MRKPGGAATFLAAWRKPAAGGVGYTCRVSNAIPKRLIWWRTWANCPTALAVTGRNFWPPPSLSSPRRRRAVSRLQSLRSNFSSLCFFFGIFMLSWLFTSVQTDPSRLFLSRRISFSISFCRILRMGWDGEVFRHFAGPSDNHFLNSAFPRSSWLPPFAVGLERRRGFNGTSVIFHKLYMVRGDFGAIWRVFSAKLALRASSFSR